jgi:hypothetical protein
MPADSPTGPHTPATLEGRYTALHQEMIEQYERYVAAGNRWAVYSFLAWEHLAVCAGSHYLLAVARVQNPWVYAVLWLGQVAVVLSAITWTRARVRVEKSPLQRHSDRTWLVFLLLCWNVAILNVLAGQPVFVFLPVLATLSSFAFLVLASFLSRRFLAAALALCATGGLIARYPTYGFLLYGVGWLVVLQTLGVVLFRKRNRWSSPKGADFPRVSAGVNRQPTGAGCDAEMSARS